MQMIDKIIDVSEKIGFSAALVASGYMGYIKEYDAALLFGLYAIIMLILIINNYDEDIDFYV